MALDEGRKRIAAASDDQWPLPVSYALRGLANFFRASTFFIFSEDVREAQSFKLGPHRLCRPRPRAGNGRQQSSDTTAFGMRRALARARQFGPRDCYVIAGKKGRLGGWS
jgi:hypothetical protein